MSFTVKLSDGTGPKGEADNLHAAQDCARALTHYHGAESADITDDESGEKWRFHAEWMEEA